jgi:hypothetical protein
MLTGHCQVLIPTEGPEGSAIDGMVRLAGWSSIFFRIGALLHYLKISNPPNFAHLLISVNPETLFKEKYT